MEYVIGIDLGTCNSAVAHLKASGYCEIIRNDGGEQLTPSVINFGQDEEIYFGKSAQRVLSSEPDNTVCHFKREMGKAKKWVIFDKEYSPVMLSAFLLEKLKNDALAELQKTNRDARIQHCVITVPAEFSSAARKATKEAAELAGLDVDRLLDEPVAAVQYHQHQLIGKSDTYGTHAVVDLGGGTLDVSIVAVEPNCIRVRRSNGSTQIGGIDFDKALQKLVQAKFKEQTSGGSLSDSEYQIHQAEEIKKILTDRFSAFVDVVGKNVHGNLEQQIIVVTREEFEASIRPVIESIGETCRSIMIDLAIRPQDIRNVLLVGGSVRIPSVKAQIDAVFERESLRSRNCDEAVALGAGIFAAAVASNKPAIPFTKEQKKAVQNVRVTEVLHKHYGVIALTDEDRPKEINTFVLERGAEVPCTNEKEYHLSFSSRSVEWSIIESPDANKDPKSDSAKVIQTEIMKLNSSDKFDSYGGTRKLRATFQCDANKVLHCEFVDCLTGTKSRTNPIPLD